MRIFLDANIVIDFLDSIISKFRMQSCEFRGISELALWNSKKLSKKTETKSNQPTAATLQITTSKSTKNIKSMSLLRKVVK